MQRIVLGAVALLLLTTTACGGGGNHEADQGKANSGLSVAFAAQAAARAADLRASKEASQPSAAGGGGQSALDTAQRSAGEVALQSTGGGLPGLTVLGYGMASTAADNAILEFYFSTGTAVKPDAVPGNTGSSSSEQTQSTTAIKESDLQPVIDAIVAKGVARDSIEFIGGSYYDVSYSSATLRVTTKDLAKLGDIIQAATDAAATLTNIALQATYVSYTVSDCAGLERQALQAAKEDAQSRADVLAGVLGVTRGALTAASTYSYSTFGGTVCGGNVTTPYPIGGVSYAEGQASNVQLSASITVTYAIQ
jgi:uncharacterized protein YggE